MAFVLMYDYLMSAEIVLRKDICDIQPVDLNMRGIQLLGVDVENVLTDYHDTTVRPEAAAHLSHLALSVPRLEIVLITNNTNEPTRPYGTGFIEEVSQQVGNIPFYHLTDSLKGKTKPDLFIEAIKDSPNNVTPEFAAHIDDQFKSLKGLNAAGFDTFFWTLPYGKHQHLGVKCMRPAERLGRAMIGYQQRLTSIYRGGLFE